MGKLIIATVAFGIAALCITALCIAGKLAGPSAAGLVVALLAPSPLGPIVQGLLKSEPTPAAAVQVNVEAPK